MRSAATAFALAIPLLVPVPAKAAEASPAIALFTGAATTFAGFVVGSALLATSGDDRARNNAGWLAMETGFALAPLVAHGVSGEWWRGVAFAALPTATLAGTATFLDLEPGAIAHGSLDEQRLLWSLFGGGLFSSAIGVVDSAFAVDRRSPRAIRVLPSPLAGGLGLRVVGAL